MERLNPEKLSVDLHSDITQLNPVIPRRYTVTHSDTTAELVLTIGRTYATGALSAMKDAVRAKWVFNDNQYKLYVFVCVGGPFDKSTAALLRYQIFVKELPLALEALRYGDGLFFNNHRSLDLAPIFVHFQSSYPEFNLTEFWGMPEKYR